MSVSDTVTTLPEMTYNVFSGTLNPTHFTSLPGLPPGTRIIDVWLLDDRKQLAMRVCKQLLSDCELNLRPLDRKSYALPGAPLSHIYVNMKLDATYFHNIGTVG